MSCRYAGNVLATYILEYLNVLGQVCRKYSGLWIVPSKGCGEDSRPREHDGLGMWNCRSVAFLILKKDCDVALIDHDTFLQYVQYTG